MLGLVADPDTALDQVLRCWWLWRYGPRRRRFCVEYAVDVDADYGAVIGGDQVALNALAEHGDAVDVDAGRRRAGISTAARGSTLRPYAPAGGSSTLR